MKLILIGALLISAIAQEEMSKFMSFELIRNREREALSQDPNYDFTAPFSPALFETNVTFGSQ
jgi:hypothetical protein